MKLISLLDPNLILMNEDLNSMDQAIEIAVKRFSKSKKFKLEKSEIVNLIKDRVSQGGIVFENGLSIPHARIKGFNDLLVCIIKPTTPFIENKTEIKTIIVMLTSEKSSDIYLKTLSSFVSNFINEDFFNNVLKCNESDDFLNLIADINVKEELTIEDIMTTSYTVVNKNTKLSELSYLFCKNNITYLPVLDEDGNFIGEVAPGDLVGLGLPKYAHLLSNLKFTNNLSSFDDLIENEDQWTVEKIYREPKIVLKHDFSIMEAAAVMTQNKRRHIPVTKDGKLVGILHILDFIHKLIRG